MHAMKRVILLGLTFCMISCGRKGPPQPPENHEEVTYKIVFYSTREGKRQIYVMDDDGGNQTRLTKEPIYVANNFDPRPSPDGKKIAFVSEYLGVARETDVYIMDIDGSNVINVSGDSSHEYDDFDPCWSPDGQKIAFVSNRGGMKDIYVVNADGSNLLNLTADTCSDRDPCWSPDGQKIAFMKVFSTITVGGEITDLGDIYVMDADGSNPTRLTYSHSAGVCGSFRPIWSPDGTKIAFFTNRDGNREIYVMNSDGTEQINLSNHPLSDYEPQWSPDGTKIAFYSYRDRNWELYVVNSDGSNLANLTQTPDSDEFSEDHLYPPAWSPNGEKIAFTSFATGHWEVYVMNADGSSPTNITNSSSNNYNPQWITVQ